MACKDTAGLTSSPTLKYPLTHTNLMHVTRLVESPPVCLHHSASDVKVHETKQMARRKNNQGEPVSE